VIARFVHHVWMMDVTEVRTFLGLRVFHVAAGGEFRGRVFARAARRLGIQQRFASASNIHATARPERFWRTLKDAAGLRLHRPLTIQDLERRVEIALAHYLLLRPHQGLHGATPAEAFLGVRPACERCEIARGFDPLDPGLRDLHRLPPEGRS
jgi:transposase InsO family protein